MKEIHSNFFFFFHIIETTALPQALGVFKLETES